MSTIVTRFAPSPTGYLHIGGARTALFNWLLARHAGGKFLLRIEDTDLARSTEAAATQLLDDLRWLGLNWDNSEIVYQSKRLPIYNAIIEDLVSRGLAYKAYETSEELTALRLAADRSKRSFLYKRPQLTDAQIREYESENRPHVVRFAMPIKVYAFDDAVLGAGQGVAENQVQDFVIRKSDGMPTYHFAVVVDDAEMGVTHILRGQEHLLNTVNHIALQDALGYTRPTYAHLSVILNADGSKMSKRDQDKKVRQATHNFLKNSKSTVQTLGDRSGLPADRLQTWLDKDSLQLSAAEQIAVMSPIGLKRSDLPEILVHDFRASGYLPEVLLNFLALLGWNPGGDRERMSIPELISLFDLKDVGKANARFNREKLAAFNTEALAYSPSDRLVAATRDYLLSHPESSLNRADDSQLAAVLKMKPGIRVLRDVDQASQFLFLKDDELSYDAAAIEKVMRKQNGFDVLREIMPIFAVLATWSHDSIEKALNAFCEQKQLGLGKVAQPIRVAISGGTISPPIFHSLEFIGKASTLARIARCLQNEATA